MDNLRFESKQDRFSAFWLRTSAESKQEIQTMNKEGLHFYRVLNHT